MTICLKWLGNKTIPTITQRGTELNMQISTTDGLENLVSVLRCLHNPSLPRLVSLPRLGGNLDLDQAAMDAITSEADYRESESEIR